MSRLRATLLLLTLMLVSPAAHASVAKALTVEELTAQADLVVRGHVTTQEAAWTRSGRIVTTVHLAVDAGIKGQPPETVDVRHVGGHVGQIGQQVSGEVAFTPGEEVVLFLRAHPTVTGTFVVVGMSQGKFHVDRGASIVPGVKQELDGLGLLTESGKVEDRPGERLSLQELVDRVGRAAGR
jgi:hypothetical protein